MPASEDSYVPETVELVESDPEFLRADRARQRFHENLKTEKNPLYLIALGSSCFDNPAMLSGFIVWLLECNVLPIKIIQSGLLQHFFIHHYLTINDEEESQKDNAFKKTYELLDLFASININVKRLVNLAKNTFCGMRGAECNNPKGGKFAFLNLLNQEAIKKTKLPEFRQDLVYSLIAFDAPYKLPELTFSSESVPALYDLFGFDFLCLLDCDEPKNKAIFLQIKAHDSAGILDALCDRISSNEFQIDAFQKIMPFVADLFSSLSRDAFSALVSKNPLFLLLSVYHLDLLQKLSVPLVQNSASALVANTSLYSEVYLLVQLCLILKEMSPMYDAVFISSMRHTLFQKTLSSVEIDFDDITALESLSTKDLCAEKINEWCEKLTQTIEPGINYQKLLELRNSFSSQIMLIELTYPQLFNEAEFLLDEYELALKAFYIESRWNKKSRRLPFSLLRLLNSCLGDLSEDLKIEQVRILLTVLRRTDNNKLILAVLKYVSQHHDTFLNKAAIRIFLKESVSLDVITFLFSAMPITMLGRNNRVNGASFIRPQPIYSFCHIFLAMKWVYLVSAPENGAMNEMMRMLSNVLLENAPFSATRLIEYAQNLVNELRSSNRSTELKKVLSTLLQHIRVGNVDFAALLNVSNGFRREREESPDVVNDEPPARRAFYR